MKFKIEKGSGRPSSETGQKEVPVFEWTSAQFVEYYKTKYREHFKIDTSKSSGMILVHINPRSINKLFRHLGVSEEVDKNELYREYIDWVFDNKKTRKDGLIRIWFFSNEDMMTDFLDDKARKMVEKEMGSDEEFKKSEEERLRKAVEFYKKKEGQSG